MIQINGDTAPLWVGPGSSLTSGHVINALTCTNAANDLPEDAGGVPPSRHTQITVMVPNMRTWFWTVCF